jgi:hypothetical protein
MPDLPDENADLPHKVNGETSLVRRSGFLTRRTRELAQQVRDLNLADGLEVVFPDENLEAIVRGALEKPEGPLTREDLKSLYALDNLDSDNPEIENISGLEHATNLTELWLIDNNISDISPIANLTNLGKLVLGNSQISDISPMASLTNLTELLLSSNQISDISTLASLTNLISLDLRDNPLSQESINTHVPNLRARGVIVTT